ncbi:FAD-NAD(P)-binding-domain-containing protein [Diaporthe sp. PMI_573]|nr:FAD-NAD(P)-binding-domain-containing protein [Diaporthaceae sp. PMI_573]
MASSGTADAHVAIIGAGPRGTSTLERLCASAKDFLAPGSRLTVHVVDPSPPGAGRVWRTDQSQQLLMNTVSSQISLYTDKSVTIEGPICPGPSLHEWAVTAGGMPELGPDNYPTRAFYGRYLAWVFSETVRNAPEGVEVEVHAARAVRLDDGPGGSQVLTLSNGGALYGLSAVMLALGHLPLLKSPEGLQLATHAARNGLRYIEPANPADVELSAIASGEKVFLRGLGLNFFDYMALLTLGRGGRFSRLSSGKLQYHPSGSEPHMFAGSRRGIPYQSRGANAKGVDGRHYPLLITEDVIAGFRKRAESGNPPDFLAEIWPLVAKEVETVYYELLLKQQGKEHAGFQKRYLAAAYTSPQETEILNEFGVPADKRWSWDRISKPQGKRTFASADEWRGWLISYLLEDAEEAALGNLEGPLKAALDVLRDLRNEVRLIVDHAGLGGASRRDHLDGWYTPFNGFLSIGPPLQRIEQMVALMEAGVLEVLGPRPEARATAGGWLVRSPLIPGDPVRVTTLIEARLPEPNLSRTADGLLSHLLRTSQCRSHTLDGCYDTGGLDVTEAPYHIIDALGRPHARRFAVGVPTEGVHWVTAAGIRPGVNSVTLQDSDAIARAALRVVVAEADGLQQMEV